MHPDVVIPDIQRAPGPPQVAAVLAEIPNRLDNAQERFFVLHTAQGIRMRMASHSLGETPGNAIHPLLQLLIYKVRRLHTPAPPAPDGVQDLRGLPGFSSERIVSPRYTHPSTQAAHPLLRVRAAALEPKLRGHAYKRRFCDGNLGMNTFADDISASLLAP